MNPEGPADPAPRSPRRRLVGTRRPRSERAYATRRWIARELLAGLPAVVLAAGVAYAWSRAAADAPTSLPGRYLAEGLKMARLGRTDRALVYLQRAADERVDEVPPPDRLEAARRLLSLNDPVRGGALLDALSPSNRPGYPPAQVLRASLLMDRPGATRADLEAAEAHLLRALKAEPQFADANARLVQLYLNSGRNKLAVPFLERTAPERPELLIVLAKIDAIDGNRDRALVRLRQARDRFRTLCEARPDDHDSRIYWGEAALIMEDFAAAAAILKDGYARSDDPRYPRALGRVYLAWHDIEARDPEVELTARLDLLEQGLRYDPGNLLLLDRFAAPIRAGGPVARRALEALNRQVETGRETAAVRYALGVAAYEAKDVAAARSHWERAYRFAPDIPFYANNYADTLVNGPDPDPRRALEVIGPVVERWPAVMAFRDTRGQALAKLGRWYEARLDLEEALRIGPPTPATRRALALVYDRLGLPALAEEQHRLAETPERPAP